MRVYGCHGVFIGVHGFLYMSVYGCLWVSMVVSGFLLVYGYLRVSWVSMAVYGSLWMIMGIYECLWVSWVSMGIYGCLWVSMSACGFLGVFWVVGSGYVWYLSVSYRIYWFNTFCLCSILLIFVWLFYLISLRINFNFWIEIHNLKLFTFFNKKQFKTPQAVSTRYRISTEIWMNQSNYHTIWMKIYWKYFWDITNSNYTVRRFS